MNSLIGVIVVILAIVVMDRIYKWSGRGSEKTRTTLDVLKIVSKHECFGKFKDDPGQFKQWAAKFLALKGYKIIDVNPDQKDTGKDLILQDRSGEIVYVECKLSNPANWDVNVDLPVVQKLIGAMAGDGVKKGLIITTAAVSESVKNYLREVKISGYDVKYIDGDALVRELYDLREVKLPEVIEKLGLKLMKS